MSALTGLMSAAQGTNAITSISSSYSEAQAMKLKGDMEKDISESNAQMADVAAGDAVRRGETAARLNTQRVRQVIGAQRASLAAQGVDVNKGSAAKVQESSAVSGALDAMTIRNNAFREAMGYRVQALDFRMRGNLARTAAYNEAGNTFMTGGMRAIGYGLQAGYWAQKGGGGRGGGVERPIGYAAPNQGGWSGGRNDEVYG